MDAIEPSTQTVAPTSNLVWHNRHTNGIYGELPEHPGTTLFIINLDSLAENPEQCRLFGAFIPDDADGALYASVADAKAAAEKYLVDWTPLAYAKTCVAGLKADLAKSEARWAALASVGREISDSDASEIKRMGETSAEMKQERDEAMMFAKSALDNGDILKAEVVRLREEKDTLMSLTAQQESLILKYQRRLADYGCTDAFFRGDLDGVALIAAERRRQIEAEGWTPEHDDEHTRGQIALAAAC